MTPNLTPFSVVESEPERSAAASRRGRRGNGEGSIVHRADGRWTAYVTLDDGRRKYFYAKTRAEVARKLAGGIHSHDNHLPIPSDELTVASYLSEWIEGTRSHLKPATWMSYESIVRVHLIPALGRYRITRLRPQDVSQFITAKLEEGLSPRRVEYLRAVLRKALNDAVRWDLVLRNVAALSTPPRVEHKEVHPFTPDEARQFLESVRGADLEPLYVLAICTGLRQGELLALRWSDVDLAAGRVHVRRSLQRAKGAPMFSSPKTERSRRSVPLPGRATVALQELAQRQGKVSVENAAATTEALVFCGAGGAPLLPSSVSHSFTAAVAAAGLRHQRFHDLRHACASYLLAEGVSARVVMEMLGHSQITLTLQTYSHLMPGATDAAATGIDRALGSLP